MIQEVVDQKQDFLLLVCGIFGSTGSLCQGGGQGKVKFTTT